jgi:hypothetical protein
LIVIVAGTCTTGTAKSLPVAAVPCDVWPGSPPPHALAVLETDVAELAATFTVSVIAELPPPAIAVVDPHSTEFVPVPLHVHALPVDV